MNQSNYHPIHSSTIVEILRNTIWDGLPDVSSPSDIGPPAGLHSVSHAANCEAGGMYIAIQCYHFKSRPAQAVRGAEVRAGKYTGPFNSGIPMVASPLARWRTVENNIPAINMAGVVSRKRRPPSARRAWAISGRQLVSQQAA